jgi:hypothetical protein
MLTHHTRTHTLQENASPEVRKVYTDPHIKLIVPFGTGWTVSVNSFWTLLNSVVRRFVQAANIRTPELRDPSLVLANMSEAGKQAMFM